MPKSVQSESPSSGTSALSGRYELLGSPFTSGKQDSAAATAPKGVANFDDDDLYGVADFVMKQHTTPLSSATSRTESQPPSLQPVRHASVPRREASPLAGFSPLQPDRRHPTNGSSVNTNTNGSSMLGDDNKSTATACSRQSEGEGRSERHRRYSQALQTPLTDPGNGVASFVRTIRQLSSPANPPAVADAQSARTDGRRGPSRLAAPATTNITAVANTARRPSGGRLEPLSNGINTTDANSASDLGAAIVGTGAAPAAAAAAAVTRTRTPAEKRRGAPHQPALVTSAPTYLPGAAPGSISGRGGGRATNTSFLREPLRHTADTCVDGDDDDDESGGSSAGRRRGQTTTTTTATSARGGSRHDEHSSPDSGLLLRNTAALLPPSEATRASAHHPVLTLPDKGSRMDVRDGSPAASPTPTMPHGVRAGASRSGSGVFSMHTLVSRNKNVDNFDYGLSALGFPVEGAKQSHPQPRQGSVSPGSPGGQHSGGGSFLAAASDLTGGERRGSGLMHVTTSPNDTTAITNTTTHSTLPSLLLVNKHSGLQQQQQQQQQPPQHHQGSHSAAGGVATGSSVSSVSLTGNSAQQTPLMPPMRRTSNSERVSERSANATAPSSAATPVPVPLTQQTQRQSSTAYKQHPPSSTLPVGVSDSSESNNSTTSAGARGSFDKRRKAGNAAGMNSAGTRANTTPPRPPPLSTPHDATQLKSPDYTPQLRISGSPSLRSLEETRAGLGVAYEEVAVPASFASNAGTLPSSSNGSSGALASVSLRSIVLQPRRLPRNLDDVYDLRGESSNDFFEPSKRVSGAGGRGLGSTATSGSTRSSSAAAAVGGAGPLAHTQPAPGVGTPDKLSPKLLGRRPAPLAGSADEVAREVDRDVLVPPAVAHGGSEDVDVDVDEDEDDSLLFDDDNVGGGDGRSSASDEDPEEDGSSNSSDAEARSAGSGPDKRAAQASSQSPKRRSDKSSATASATSPDKSRSIGGGAGTQKASGARNGVERVRSSSGGGSGGNSERRTVLQARDEAAEEREAGGASGETFLPFSEVAAVGSRGFSSLMLTSFLRHAGSSEPVWTPSSSGVVWSHHPAASTSSSPPSSMAATVTGIPYGSLCASTSSQGSGPGPVAANTALKIEASGKQTLTEETPLPLADGERDGARGEIRRGGSAAASSPHGNSAVPPSMANVPGSATLRVPAPPRVASPRTLGRGPRERSAFASERTAVAGDTKLPSELLRAGILRWTKPLSAAQVVAEDGDGGDSSQGAASSQLTSERLMRQLELSNHGAWQDVRGLSILEHRRPTPTAATRVFAVDKGYAVRVVQNDLMGDCETDECVERCAAAATPASPLQKDDATQAIPPMMTLPSVLMDNAVQHFVADGENAIALMMDTASSFALEHSEVGNAAGRREAPPTNAARKGSSHTFTRKSTTTGESCVSLVKEAGGSAEEVNAAWSTSVVYATCRKIVDAFSAFKESQSASQPNLIADLKMAVALVPVHVGSSTAATPIIPSMNSPLTPASTPAHEKQVFYDVVSQASSTQDCCRPLEVATSPIFGTCLNECQWLVVEDEDDINAAFALLTGLFAELHGQTGFLYIQFLHQCFIPGTSASGSASGSGAAGNAAGNASGVAGFARRGREALASGDAAHAADGLRGALNNHHGGVHSSCLPSIRNSRHGDIVVSSFTLACTRYPQVIELILDQRADTPWPLLRYALGKGPSTVLGVVRVHEEDEEAAYPLSLLQRMRAIQHPRPRRGSVRTFVTEQRNKITDLKRRLAEAEEKAARTASTAAARATMKRLSVLISKLECSAKDAEEFLFDPESAHVPVYVDARRLPHRATGGERNTVDIPTDQLQHRQEPEQRQQRVLQAGPPSPPRVPHSPAAPERVAPPVLRSSLVCTSEPLLLAMVENYDPIHGTVADGALVAAEHKGTARWTLSPLEDATPPARGHTRQPSSASSPAAPAPRTLTAWLTLTKSVPFEVDEVTSLDILHESAAAPAQQLPACETWRRFGARFHAGCNATAVVVQEKQEESRLWSLRVALEVVHGVLKDTWSTSVLPGSADVHNHHGGASAAFAREAMMAATPPSHAVTRVAVSVYHVSGSAVADLLRNSPTSRVITGRAAAGSVAFTPFTLGVRPLCGAAVPLNVLSQVVDSLPQLEAVLREAVERLRHAQNAVKGGGGGDDDAASGADGAATADLLTRRCLTAPGYTVMTVELTQRVVKREEPRGTGSGGSESGVEEDVYVSSLSVIDLGGHFSLLRDATEACSAMEKAGTRGTADNKAVAKSPSLAATLLARLLMKRRDLVVCAAALPVVPSAATAYGLLSALKEFQQNATRAPHIHNTTPPGSVRRFVAHLQAVVTQAEGQWSSDSLTNIRNALKRAQAMLSDPAKAAFVSYPYSAADAEAMAELPAVSQLAVDNAALLRLSSLVQHNNANNINHGTFANNLSYNNASSTITTAGTVSTIGGSGSSPEVSTVPDGSMEKSSGVLAAMLPQHDVSVAGHYAAERLARSRESSAPAERPTPSQAPLQQQRDTGSLPSSVLRRTSTTQRAEKATADEPLRRDSNNKDVSSRRVSSAIIAGKQNTEEEPHGSAESGRGAGYYGVHYKGRDFTLTRHDVQRHVALQRVQFPLSAAKAAESSAHAADKDDDVSEEESEPVLMPSVLVLNAATTGAYVKRHGTRVRVPLSSASGTQYASYAADEVVNIKPTSTGLKSSLLMRAVSCVSRGRTAALLISDTESCDSASCIAWLTLRTVMGGVFQALKLKEVEGVRHCAVLRAFLIEEKNEDEFADLLAPRLTAAQPRHLLTRLKHSPFCGPLPADATTRPVKDLQDVNVALSAVLAAARLAHQAPTNAASAAASTGGGGGSSGRAGHAGSATNTLTTTTNEPLRGAIALQLTFHQFIPATSTQAADVVVSSLWCVQMGCSAGWMDALQTRPHSATGTLLEFWAGGPCYTTAVVGLSRFGGVRMATWRELLTAQRRLRAVTLRLPRPGSVQTYIAALQHCLRCADAAAAAHSAHVTGVSTANTDGVATAADKTNSTVTTSASSSATSTPKRVGQVSGNNSSSNRADGSNPAKSVDAIMRVTALLKEAQRLVERGCDVRKSAQLPGQLAHEAKTFAALD